MKSSAGFSTNFKGKRNQKQAAKKSFKTGHIPNTLEMSNLMTTSKVEGTTKKQIEEGLWDLMVPEWKVKLNSDDLNCIICFDADTEAHEEQILSLQCGHSFHAECLKEWLSANACCPVCRD